MWSPGFLPRATKNSFATRMPAPLFSFGSALSGVPWIQSRRLIAKNSSGGNPIHTTFGVPMPSTPNTVSPITFNGRYPIGTVPCTPGIALMRSCSATLMPFALNTNPSEMRTRSLISRTTAVPLVQVLVRMETPTMSAPAVNPNRYGACCTAPESNPRGTRSARSMPPLSAVATNHSAGTESMNHPACSNGIPSNAYVQNRAPPSGTSKSATCAARQARPATPSHAMPARRGARTRGASAASGLVLDACHAGQSDPPIPARRLPPMASPMPAQLMKNPSESHSRNHQRSRAARATPSGTPAIPPAPHSAAPAHTWLMNTCRRLAPTQRAIANSFCCSATAVVMPVPTMNAQLINAIALISTNPSRNANICLSNPLVYSSLGSSDNGSLNSGACSATHAFTSVPGLSATMTVVT